MDFTRKVNRIYAENDAGKVIAEVTFPSCSEGVVSIDHTYVDESLRGQGIADRLMEETYDLLKEEGLMAIPVCSYAVVWYQRHPEKRDVISEK